MNLRHRVAATLLWLSGATCIFLAFGWPFLVGRDPASGTFRVLAITALLAFLAALVAAVSFRGEDGPEGSGGKG